MRVKSERREGTVGTTFYVETDLGWRVVSKHSFVHPRLTGYVSVSGKRRKVDVRLLDYLRGPVDGTVCGPVEAVEA
jgi:hypothetical protein